MSNPWGDGPFNMTNPQHIVALLMPSENDDPLVKDKKFASALKVSVGDMEEAKMGIKLDYKSTGGNQLRSELGASETLVVSFSFIVKDGVDPFSLGELSGSVKNILSLGTMLSKMKYQLKSKMGRDNSGRAVYTLSMVSSEEQIVDLATKILDYQKPEKLKGSIEVSASPLDENKKISEEFLKAKVALEWSVKRSVFNMLEKMMTNGEKISDQEKIYLTFIKSLKNMEIELKFEDMKEFWDKFIDMSFEGSEEGKEEFPFKVWSWATLQGVMIPYLQQLFSNEKIPEPVFELYKKLDYLTGLHAINICVADHLIQLDCEDFALFSLLPPLEAVRKQET